MDINSKLPKHVAIIMDGNGRWAKQKGFSRNKGHRKGAEVLGDITKYAEKIGIQNITVYAFSTENWNRPKEEVDGLMDLLRSYLDKYYKESKKNNLRIRVIGSQEGLPEDIREKINTLHRMTKDKSGLGLNIAINYGGRDEILRAAKKMYQHVVATGKDITAMTEKDFELFLDTAGIEDPDLMIRTSGEIRTSNFLPWQIAYCEFYFAECLWPEFSIKEFDNALETYTKRQRRFGKSE